MGAPTRPGRFTPSCVTKMISMNFYNPPPEGYDLVQLKLF
jgi:hypothetical protein